MHINSILVYIYRSKCKFHAICKNSISICAGFILADPAPDSYKIVNYLNRTHLECAQ